MYRAQLIKSSKTASWCSVQSFSLLVMHSGTVGAFSVPCEGTVGLFGQRVLISWQHTRECSLGNGGLACHWWPPVEKHRITSEGRTTRCCPLLAVKHTLRIKGDGNKGLGSHSACTCVFGYIPLKRDRWRIQSLEWIAFAYLRVYRYTKVMVETINYSKRVRDKALLSFHVDLIIEHWGRHNHYYIWWWFCVIRLI